MIEGFDELKVKTQLKEYLTPSQAISRQERLHGREPQLEKIRRALNSPGRHVFIYGDRGVGKTSLAKTAAFIAQPSAQELALVACGQGSDFFSLIQDAAKKLYGSPARVDRNIREAEGGLNLGIFTAKMKQVTETGIIPTISTINDATELLGEVSQRFSDDAVVIVDEFDQLQDQKDKKLFADLIKQLSDQEIGVRLVLCGIGSSLRELIGVHLSTDRYITPVELSPLKYDARWAILSEAAAAFNIEFERETVVRIGNISDGFPYFIHLVGEHLVWAMHDDENTTKKSRVRHFDNAVKSAIEDAYTSLKNAYDTAIQKYKHTSEYEEVLWSIAHGKIFLRSTDDIYKNSYVPLMRQLKKAPLERRVFSQRLNRLKNDAHGNIISSPTRSWYTFTENLVRGYVRLRAEKQGISIGSDHFLG